MTDEMILDELYKVNNDNEAEDMISKLKEKQQETRRLLEIIAYKQQELQLQKNIIEEQLRKDTEYYTWKLEGYFNTLTEGVKTTATGIKKYKLLSGTLVINPEKQEFIKDDEKILEYLKANNPEYIKVTESPMWGELKKTVQVKNGSVVTQDGEIIECIKVEIKPATFKVEVEK